MLSCSLVVAFCGDFASRWTSSVVVNLWWICNFFDNSAIKYSLKFTTLSYWISSISLQVTLFTNWLGCPLYEMQIGSLSVLYICQNQRPKHAHLAEFWCVRFSLRLTTLSYWLLLDLTGGHPTHQPARLSPLQNANQEPQCSVYALELEAKTCTPCGVLLCVIPLIWIKI